MELDKLKELIADVLNVDPEEITNDTTFIDDLGADSLDIYQIIMGIEDEFGIKMAEDRIENIKTVGEAVALIKEARA
ncbi:acyl carrier protein [Butyrivibrio sp. MC2013]|uniref:acyl carrier protein n=1 Tax=Butyrivibrio sp. MC2013 TaxID=1280686 RepID=UPI0004146946|nr:acyl carrier protein [Butyrivibrio sp. MC2013]